MKLPCLSLALLWVACGPAQRAGQPAAEPAPEPTAAEPKPAEWAKMTHEQKTEYMQTKVMPHMGEVFSVFDAKRYPDIKCVTCHGDGAKKGEFTMPSADLPKLSTTGKFEEEMKHAPDVTKFMMEKVVPEMATLLQMQPYDPETKQGFGCFGCHQPKP